MGKGTTLLLAAATAFSACNKGRREDIEDKQKNQEEQIAALLQENEKLHGENDSLKENQITIQGQLNQAFAIIEVNDRNVKQILAQLHEEIQNGGRNTPALLSQLLTFMTAYEQRLQNLENSDTENQTELDDLGRNIKNIKTELNSIRNQLDGDRNYIGNVEDRVIETETDIEKLKKDYNDCVAMILHLAKVVRERKDEMTARLNTLEGKIGTMEKNPALQNQVNELTEELRSFKAVLLADNADITDLKERFGSLDMRVQTLRNLHYNSNQPTEAEISRYGKEIVEAFNWARNLNLIEATSLEEFNPYGTLTNGTCNTTINNLARLYPDIFHGQLRETYTRDQNPTKRSVAARLGDMVCGPASSEEDSEAHIQYLLDHELLSSKINITEDVTVTNGFFVVMLKEIYDKMGLNTTDLWTEAMFMSSSQDSNHSKSEE